MSENNSRLASPGVPAGEERVASDEPPDTPALDAWYEAHPYDRGRDNPKTRLWFPHEAPYAVLQVTSRGPDWDQVLPDPAKPMVDVYLGGSIDVGGYLSDMEAYFAAVLDGLRVARWQAETIAARVAEEAQSDG